MKIRLNGNLNTLVEAAVRPELAVTAESVAAAAQSMTPTATGGLSATARAETDGETVHVVLGSPKAFYAHFIEWGSAHNSASAPLRKAAEQHGRYEDI